MAGQILNPSKWSSRAQAAAGDYKTGVTSTTKDWSALTAAAEQTYKDGVAQAVARDAFGKGVRKAGTDKWKSAASNIGSSRYSQGVAAAQDAYNSGFGPYAAKLGSLTYPARGPRGSPQNLQRVATVATTLHQLKTGGL